MGLKEIRERFFQRFPEARALDSALRSSSNPTPSFFLDQIHDDPDLKGTGVVLLRLGTDLERRFGINGEVAAYFTTWNDFQRRSFNAITQRTPDLVRRLQLSSTSTERFTPSRRVGLLISKDPGVGKKLEEWQRDSYSEMTLVPIDVRDQTEEQIRVTLTTRLKEKLAERDLYRVQNPVSGLDFFGRGEILTTLTAAIDADQNVAILGLRRSGKTSVLRELQAKLLPKRIVMPIADFQMLDDKSIGDLAVSIASELNEQLKSARDKGLDVWVGNERDQDVRDVTPATLSDRIKRVASRNPSIRIAIAVDEVEWPWALSKKNPGAVKTILGALRSSAQGNPNVSLVFSGVANRLFRTSSLGEDGAVDNPVFGQVSSHYLRSFSLDETAALLTELGRPMILDWSEEAIEVVHDLTGGFPYFVRDLASEVRGALLGAGSASNDFIEIGRAEVQATAATWSARAAADWDGIVSALANHYPGAADLLDAGLSASELTEWVSGDGDAMIASDDLVALGLLEREDDQVRASLTLKALQRLSDLQFGSPRWRTAQATDDISALIRGGESHDVEFKESSRIDARTGKKEVYIEDAIVKTVAAFLNSDGGQLLIGIADNSSVKGIGPDLELFKGSEDRYERWLRGDLLAKRISEVIVGDCVETVLETVRGKRVARVRVKPSQHPAWVDDSKIYRRLGNQTLLIDSGREIQAFLSSRTSLEG